MGTVFALTPPATTEGSWIESVLYSFAGGTDGAMPVAGLLAGQGGTLYGTTEMGGVESCKFETALGCGTVFSLIPPASVGGAWTEAVLHAFSGRPDGAAPVAGLIAQNGRFVGTTLLGGVRSSGCNFGQVGCGGGTVFTLTPPAIAGGAWTEKLLYKFKPDSSDGESPSSGLVASTTGALYGTTVSGDINYAGTVFALSPPATGGSWTESILHRFRLGNGVMDGSSPEGGLVFNNHELYGTTSGGGVAGEFGAGAVFEVTP